MGIVRTRIIVAGRVQGVGFRPHVYRAAHRYGLAGHVRNVSGAVVVELEGPEGDVGRCAARIRQAAPAQASIRSVEEHSIEPTGAEGFGILPSQPGAVGIAPPAIVPDIGTCPACLADLSTAGNRRHDHPFVSCTDCGPRFTIVDAPPYDRARTSMGGFPMCRRCRAEYRDPDDRRFHAEPIACPDCGPTARFATATGVTATGGAAIDAAAKTLARGGLIAVKGLGGYHLACDAADEEVVQRLRAVKRREAKPFAVMVPDLPTARRLCRLGRDAEAALRDPAAPIVLAPARGRDAVAPGVAPGSGELGLLLPYTPLHHLLMGHLRRPVVLTSANAAGDAIVIDDAEMAGTIAPRTDGVLGHDRPIVIRCDDSVVRVRDGTRTVLRRSRGLVPGPVALPVPSVATVLAVGAHQKSTVTLARGDWAVPGPHVGDLSSHATRVAFEAAISHLGRLCGARPDVIAHDLHPEYASTKWAQDTDLPLVGVQHHHAHVAACLAEHGRTGRAVGVAYDGAGWGEDGTSWGGEVLVADLASSTRAGHLRVAPLPGGDHAAREPWRMALVWIRATFGTDTALRWAARLPERQRELAPGVLSIAEPTRTSSAGRLFDAAAAIVGLRIVSAHEGHAAADLEEAAGSTPAPPDTPMPRIEAGTDGRLRLDPTAILAWLHDSSHPVAAKAAGFHDAFGAGTAGMAIRVARDVGLGQVVLSGGVFQNVRFTDVVVRHLSDAGLEVLTHRSIPPNDGGISFGQAVVAATRNGTCIPPKSGPPTVPDLPHVS